MLVGELYIEHGHLHIGGCDACELAKKYGTPLYVLDIAHVEKTARAYVDLLKKEYPYFTVCYASKAFSCTGIYNVLAPLGLGADVVSGGELYTAIKGGMNPKKLYFHGNNKTESEIRYAFACGVENFVVDSAREIEMLNDLVQGNCNVLVRVNPGVEAHTHRYIQTATVDSKFGFSIADGSAKDFIVSLQKFKKLNFVGLSAHIGSQIFEPESFKIEIDKLTDFIVELRTLGIKVARLDIGGGFGIRYIPQDSPLTPEQYMVYVVKALKANIERKRIEPPRLIIEPGRSLVGEAGITLYTVGAIKTIKNVKTYAAVDGGMFDNIRPMLYGAEYSVIAANKAEALRDKVYSIAGKCCESGDVIIQNAKLPELYSGDILAVLSTGAYHYSMASNYNRNLVPPVIAVKNGCSCYMVKPQTYEDLTRNDCELSFAEDAE